jgi:hypothetical protein
MKLTIDTTKKTIEVTESTNIADVVNTVKELFPKGAWKKFKLITTTEQVIWQSYFQDTYDNYPYH